MSEQDPRQTIAYFTSRDGGTLKLTITDIEPAADGEAEALLDTDGRRETET